MRLKPLFQLVIPVILTGALGCDNVAWGGVEVDLRTPRNAAAEEGDTPDEDPDTVPEEPAAPSGPLLGLVSVDDGSARFRPVAVLGPERVEPLPWTDTPGGLERLAAERISGERRFILFSRGRRVGTFFPGSPGPVDRTYCNARPTVDGRIEVLPEAGEVSRFLALPEEVGEGRAHEGFSPITSTRAQRIAALQIAGRLYPRLGARWPPSVLESRADLQVLRPKQEPLVAATFLYGDRLQVGEAPETAYSLFFLAAEVERGFSPVYVRYRRVGDHGKQAPRIVDHADWNRDGSDEILLEVFGSDARWFVTLEPEGPGWEESFREPCPSAPLAASDAERRGTGGGAGARGGNAPPPRR